MSILTDFVEIRQRIGEARYKEIVAFLRANPQYTLDDVYYKSDIWDKSVEWAKTHAVN
ncbi:hypothetical protein J6A31_05945 [bacterium]|nr:hypothetical protein [bacterium]